MNIYIYVRICNVCMYALHCITCCVIHSVGLTEQQFVEWCMLIGNDFTGTDVFPRNHFNPLPDMDPMTREIVVLLLPEDQDQDDNDDDEEEDVWDDVDSMNEEVRLIVCMYV